MTHFREEDRALIKSFFNAPEVSIEKYVAFWESNEFSSSEEGLLFTLQMLGAFDHYTGELLEKAGISPNGACAIMASLTTNLIIAGTTDN